MISYRELAMRVVGRPLRVSDTKSRPAAHRVTALALTAAMVAALSAPAFAGTYYLGNDSGDITVTHDTDGNTYVKRGGGNDKGVLDNGDIVINGGTGTDYEGDKTNISQSSDSSSTSVSTLEADEPTAPVVVEEDTTDDDTTDTEPTPVVTWPEETSDQQSVTSGQKDDESTDGSEQAEPEKEADAENEGGSEETSGQGSVASGQTSDSTPEGTTDYSSKDDNDKNNAVTYESKSPAQVFTEAASNIIKIINRVKDSTLNVTLDNVSIDASGRGNSALTIEGEGNTTLNLTGDNTLKGDAGYAGLDDVGFNRQPAEGEIPVDGKLTITGTGSLTATGGDADDDDVVGDGIYSKGDLEIAGGIIRAEGGNGSDGGGHGIGAEGDITISSGTIESAIGGEANGGFDSTSGNGIYSMGSMEVTDGTIKNAQGGKNEEGNAGDGIQVEGGSLKIKNSNITATGGNSGTNGGSAGSGINGKSQSKIDISGGNITTTGGNGYSITGDGILTAKDVTVSGGSVTATGGNSYYDGCLGGSGIHADNVTLTGGTTTVIGGDCVVEGGAGGNGISATEKVDINGTSWIIAKGGNAVTGGEDSEGGNAISGKVIFASGNVAIRAAAGAAEGGTNGSAFKQNGEVLAPEELARELGENAYLEAVDADGNTTYKQGTPPKGFPGYVEPASDDSDPEQEPVIVTPAGVPGFEFNSTLGNTITVHTEVSGDTLVFSTLHYGAVLRTTLGQLRTLKAQGINQITFRTLLHTTTLSIDTLLALGGDDTAVVLTHNGKSAQLLVGGVVE